MTYQDVSVINDGYTSLPNLYIHYSAVHRSWENAHKRWFSQMGAKQIPKISYKL